MVLIKNAEFTNFITHTKDNSFRNATHLTHEICTEKLDLVQCFCVNLWHLQPVQPLLG